VFGSAATDEEFDPRRSDLDFIVEFGADQDLGPWLQHYFAFREELSNLFGYPVDLVMSSAMKNPQFIREANRTRRLLYGA
jgi:predicted nucleotidyltransferase